MVTDIGAAADDGGPGGRVKGPADRNPGPDLLDRFRRQLRQETRRVAVGRVPEDAPALRMGQVQLPHRAGEPDVAESPFFGQLVGVECGAFRREQPFLQPDDEHGRELESLGRMQCHQLHAIEPGRGLGLARLKRGMGQECGQRRQAVVIVRGKTFRGIDEFVQVFNPRFALVVLLPRVVRAQPRVLDDHAYLLVQGQLRDLGGEAIDQCKESLQGAGRARGQGGHERLRGIPQRQSFLLRDCANLVDGCIADAARRQVDDPFEGQVVSVGLGEAQVAERVLDLGALEEPQAAIDAIRNARRHQRLLERPRLGIRAIQHGRRSERQAGALVFADALEHEVGLVALIEGGVDADRFAALGRSPQFLAHAIGVLRDDRVGGAEDHCRRTVVLLEPVDGRRKIAAEMLHVLDPCAAPAIDGLVVVADHEWHARRAREELQPFILDAVGVLELIHQDVAETFAVIRAEIRDVAQRLETPEQQLGEIHDAQLLAALLILLVEPDHLLARRVAAIVQALRAPALVLVGIDESLHFARNPTLLVQLLLADDPAHESMLVFLIEDLEGLRQAGFAPMAAQQPMGDAMKSADP